ncbi:chymotrypsin BI-like [Thrips palmi]|uniref:Chymotrypsin BI-like n=1 Tax=Thrips palmi TaxID=161013 RepID=A0A6P9AA71_THRPL|nr:chymotrypsin BI-like [Thrips palmi]
MKSLSVLCAAVAVLACAFAEAQQAVETPVFFRDVPGPPKALEEVEEAEQAAAEDGRLRIFGGDVAKRGQFPYQAAIFIDLSVFCGGSLINEKWVLTAAHCVADGTIWYVLLGGTESLTPVQEGRVTHVTRGGYHHPEYNARKIINDVGVIQLMRPAGLSTYIQTVALTPKGASYLGRTGTVSGYGRTDDVNASPVSPRLRFTSLPVVDNQVCADAYGDSPLHPSVICLRAEGSSSCKGDSGGPFTVDDNGKTILVGAVSFGATAGCSLGRPVGYTNLAIFIDWISETTGIDFKNPQ